jgi:hypothetical protein
LAPRRKFWRACFQISSRDTGACIRTSRYNLSRTVR